MQFVPTLKLVILFKMVLMLKWVKLQAHKQSNFGVCILLFFPKFGPVAQGAQGLKFFLFIFGSVAFFGPKGPR